VKAAELEAAVWNHIKQLLSDPGQLIAQFQDFARLAAQGESKQQAEARKLETGIARLGREEQRLIDAYQAEVIGLEELAARRQRLTQRRQALAAQQEQQARLWQEGSRAQQTLGELSTFCERVRTRLDRATFAEKQAILQMLIERIIVGAETLEIRHVIPLRGSGADPGVPEGPHGRLRSDGMD
jgi:site-specific DNA recombinase